MGFTLTTGVPLVDVRRGESVESVHTGSLVVTDPDGEVTLAVGSVDTPVYPRSSTKPLQALAMLRAGLQPVDDEALAIAAASHSGEPRHLEVVERVLTAAGLGVDDLRCPATYPMDEAARDADLRDGRRPSRLSMNCSGKHASMLAACVAAGWPTAAYTDPEHPLQELTLDVVEQQTGERVADVTVDGCGAPLWAVSLIGLARAFGGLVQADPGTDERRVADAMRAHPFLVAGSGREDTLLMEGVDGLLMKGGAEGVHAFALADGRAFAVKVDDGAARARVPLLLAALAHLGVDATDVVAPEPVLGGGVPVGAITVRPGVFRR